jgi:hypothetical protein
VKFAYVTLNWTEIGIILIMLLNFTCIVEAFSCKEITNFSSKYFSRANNVNAHTMCYHIVEEVALSKLSIF